MDGVEQERVLEQRACAAKISPSAALPRSRSEACVSSSSARTAARAASSRPRSSSGGPFGVSSTGLGRGRAGLPRPHAAARAPRSAAAAPDAAPHPPCSPRRGAPPAAAPPSARRRPRRPRPPPSPPARCAHRAVAAARRRRVAKVVVGQRSQRVERGLRSRTRGVASTSSPWRACSIASAVRLRASAGPLSRDALRSDSRTSMLGRDRHDPARRPRMQAERVADAQRQRLAVEGLRRSRRRRRRGLLLAQLRRLHRQRAARLGRDLVEPRTRARAGRGGHRALDQRRARQAHRAALAEHLDRDLGAHQRAAEIHQHEHAVVGAHALDRRHHALGVGADLAVLEPARGLDRDVLTAHLPRQLGGPFGERRAVRDDDQPDHVRRARTRGAAARPGARTSRPSPSRCASGRSRSRTRTRRTSSRRSGGTAPRRRPSRSGTSRA